MQILDLTNQAKRPFTQLSLEKIEHSEDSVVILSPVHEHHDQIFAVDSF